MKFKAGDKVVYFQKTKDHSNNVVRIREYFVVRAIVNGEIVGPREETYNTDELEFKDIFRSTNKQPISRITNRRYISSKIYTKRNKLYKKKL